MNITSSFFPHTWLCTFWLAIFSIGMSCAQDLDEIDTAFSDILSRVGSFTGGTRTSFGSPDIFNPFNTDLPFVSQGHSSVARNRQPNAGMFERIRVIVLKVVRLLGELHQEGLGDEAVAIKQNIIDVASAVPWFENMFLPRRSGGSSLLGGGGGGRSQGGGGRAQGDDERKLEKRIDDLDALVQRYEKKTMQYSSLSPAEKEKVREENQNNLNDLNLKHSKLTKKCFYLRNRVEYLLNELHMSSGLSSKNLVDRLTV